MTKVQSGGILIGVALVINLIGRGMMHTAISGHSVGLAACVTFIMLASAVIGLFGLFRLIMGMARKE